MTRPTRWTILIALVWAGLTGPATADQERSVDEIKAEIFALAESFMGQGDPDYSKQRQFEPLLEELLAANPQPPVADRLPLLHGVWQQVWGPYSYRGDDRGVDDDLTPEEIYQVVFPGGYYYNVTPRDVTKPDAEQRIALLRGKYELVPDLRDMLKVRFTRFPGNKGRPADMPIWDLAALAEEDALPNETTIVPRFIVWLFFGGGGLREVYTDEDMRITFGETSLTDRAKEELYIMRRVE